MGNATLWKALEEREMLYAKPHDDLTHDDGMRLGELEGIVGEEGGYSAEADAGVLLDGLGIEAELHERKMSELQGGQKVRVLLGASAFRQSFRAAARRAHQQPRPRFRPLAEGISLRVSRRAHRDLARSPFPEQCLHAHRGHRLPDHHHVPRRLRRHGAGEDANPPAHGIRQRRAREEDRATERIHRALFGGHAIGTGHFPEKGSRAPADLRTGPIQHPTAIHPISIPCVPPGAFPWK